MSNRIKRRKFIRQAAQGVAGIGLSVGYVQADQLTNELRIGIVGLSVHSAAFSKLLNDPEKKGDLQGCRVTALYHPPGNPDVDFTREQLAGFEKDILAMGVRIVPSMDEMLASSDVVMIETNDGRPHLNEALPAFKAGKPVFIDKPIAQNLAEVLRIYQLSEEMNVPVFSSSALRYLDNMSSIDRAKVLSADTYSPASLEKSHTDLFWYGIHAVEPLFTVMGTGCKEVTQQQHSENGDLVVGLWEDGRVGTVRGIRSGKRGFGGTVFLKDNILTLDTFTGYRALVVKIVEFFKTKIPPVPIEETIEIYAFMEAAMESRKNGGQKVAIADVIRKAKNN